MTETLAAQHALAIIERCPFALLIMDRNGRILSYNQAFERLIGRAQAGDLQGHSITEIGDHPVRNLLEAGKVRNGSFREGPLGDKVRPSDREGPPGHPLDLVASPRGPGQETVCWTDRNNARRHFEIERIDLPGKDFAQACLFIDISRQVELEKAHDTLNEELKQHTLTDPVTGLLNQRGVVLALEPQVARSRRYNSPMAVIMIGLQCQSDCDNTRQQVARLLKDQLRWADLIGCNEQHEFMLILPETSREAGLHLAEKLQQRLQEMAVQKLDGKSIDTRYGVTGWRRSDNADTLLKRAGMALLRARSENQSQPTAL